VSGISIEIRSVSALQTTSTDEDGTFEFIDVPVGMYDVSARVPETDVPVRSTRHVFVAHPTACADVDLTARWDGQITGIVVSEQGSPVKGAIIEALADGSRFTLTATTDDMGRFTLAGLGPGRYAVGVGLSLFRRDRDLQPL
jgi:hypothetical protein